MMACESDCQLINNGMCARWNIKLYDHLWEIEITAKSWFASLQLTLVVVLDLCSAAGVITNSLPILRAVGQSLAPFHIPDLIASSSPRCRARRAPYLARTHALQLSYMPWNRDYLVPLTSFVLTRR